MAFTQFREKEFLNRLTKITEANLNNERFGVSELAREMGISRSTLHRKVKSVKGTSISKFICQVRLERAMEMLKHSSSTISEIAFDTGFHSVTYFTKCFHDHFGYPPSKVGRGEPEDYTPLDFQVNNNSRKGNRKKWFSRKFLISLIILLSATIAILIIFKPFLARDSNLKKSIAVLPFINDTPEESEMYFINGTMEAILSKLSAIKDLRVVSRRSVEQYRDHQKPIHEIAKELNVSYLLEGSGQKYGDKIKLTIQLIDGNRDTHIWSEEYFREIENIEELFILQSEIAQLVAKEIEATITLKEKELIEKIPTYSNIAYEFREKGNEAYWEYLIDPSNREALQKAEDLFRISIEYDSNYAQPYVDIARVYYNRRGWDFDLSDSYLDSVQKFLEFAFRYDNQLAAAYDLRGYYYMEMGEREKSYEAFSKIPEIDPNYTAPFSGLGALCWSYSDYLCAIENYHKDELHKGSDVTAGFLGILDILYLQAGCKDQSNYYARKALEQGGDSATYYAHLGLAEYLIGDNIPGAIDLLQKGYAEDPKHLQLLKCLGEIYLDLGQIEKSLKYYEEYLNSLDAQSLVDLYGTHVIGFAYLLNGNKEKAEYYFNLQTKYSQKLMRKNSSQYLHFAMISAWRGEKEEAIEHLRKFNQVGQFNVYVIRNFKEDLFFRDLQDEPEYQKIKSEVLAKYKADHEKVMQWLAENESL